MCEMAIMNEELDWPQKKKEMEEKRKSNKAQFDSFDNDQGMYLQFLLAQGIIIPRDKLISFFFFKLLQS